MGRMMTMKMMMRMMKKMRTRRRKRKISKLQYCIFLSLCLLDFGRSNASLNSCLEVQRSAALFCFFNSFLFCLGAHGISSHLTLCVLWFIYFCCVVDAVEFLIFFCIYLV